MQADSNRGTSPCSHPEYQPDEVRTTRLLAPSNPFDLHLVSVLGIIAIPGMMTGAILGGSSVPQAARLQMVIMFMISACTALSSITTTILSLTVIVDNEHRVRSDRIDVRPHAIWRARNWLVERAIDELGKGWETIKSFYRRKANRKVLDDQNETTEVLLGDIADSPQRHDWYVIPFET